MENNEILKRLTESEDSGFLERARSRKSNALWLRKSAQIAVRVLGRLKELNMSQKDLAVALGVAPQYVSKVVKGQENLTLETICKLESILDIVLADTRFSNVLTTYSTPTTVSFGEPTAVFTTHNGTESGLEYHNNDEESLKSA